MQLDQMTWQEVESYLDYSSGIILPVGSTEQHGPIGLIGTDALCVQTIARGAAERVGAIVAPTLAYSPASFNMGFAGTISLSNTVFRSVVVEILTSLSQHGFCRIYILNGHGANWQPLQEAVSGISRAAVMIRNWWDFSPVRKLTDALYGDWEGLHGTPSEIAITQARFRMVAPKLAEQPPKLSAEEIARYKGDRFGPPAEHREKFPDGRVGSHSALARPEHGKKLLQMAEQAMANDFSEFLRQGTLDE